MDKWTNSKVQTLLILYVIEKMQRDFDAADVTSGFLLVV